MLLDFRFGSKADIATAAPNVRFTPKSGHGSATRIAALSGLSSSLLPRGNIPETAVIRPRSVRSLRSLIVLTRQQACSNRCAREVGQVHQFDVAECDARYIIGDYSRSQSGGLAIFAAIRRALSCVSNVRFTPNSGHWN